MRRALVCVSLAALLAGGGCNVVGSGGGGEQGGVRTEVKNVTPADLQAAVTDPQVKKFYEARGWQPVWDKARADDLTAAFGDAERHALQGAAFLRDIRQGSSPAEREAALTKNALDYAKALATGIVDPRKVFDPYTVPMNRADVGAGLAQAVDKGNVRAWLASLAPQDEEYRALSDAFLRYAQAAKGPARQPVPPGETIHVGDSDKRMPAIVAALRANGYVPAAPAPAAQANKPAPAEAAKSTRYSQALVPAVKRVQQDYGIKPDGVIGDSTLEALNTGAAERARILAVNLERRRWLDRRPPGTRIDVNTAATVLTYWRDGQAKDRRPVVAGQPDWETPELGSPIFRLVANPDWTIPDSIAKEEILPKGAAYMAKEHITTKNGRLVQEPGPTSALGLVKFDMDNPHAIYLHDTPAKAMFASPERHSSHGCSRVYDAVGFARMIAQDEGQLDAFNEALASGKETGVPLPSRIPVRLMYQTAYLEDGHVVFRGDPYGWDDKLAQALGLGGALRHREIKHVRDIGP
ncbi:MAG: L,D-transpeptidase family protein [Alphaproteobacteria bacterium]|nr:L,D-transpeptidase family protein [Alphaproteobacteria bacterium]MBV9370351.1 L,D-transpeptidase family protein [Alphaproteobacteria bacterium]MBV9901992.1 L,D-transpeptidase family protein [Alphaproteobacteria bacterium]